MCRAGLIGLLLILTACSERHDEAPDVDVTAAANRAEGDIANYAALRRKGSAATAMPSTGANHDAVHQGDRNSVLPATAR